MMITTLGSKPNHYERLGLTPEATDNQIARAFAMAMSPLMPRSAGDLAEIGLAFETLRDPSKRRAYDMSIAPQPEPDPEPRASVRFPKDGWPILASVRVPLPELPAIDRLAKQAKKPEPPQPFIAAPPGTKARRATEPLVELRQIARDNLIDAEERLTEWQRPALTIGALFFGVAAIGAGLGWYASRGIAPAQAEESVSLPPPTAEIPKAAPGPVAEPTVTKAEPTRSARTAARVRHNEPKPEPVLAEESKAEQVPDIPSEQVAALAASAADAQATMPLPNSVVAQTIGRIGFACGAVASTIAVEGSPGVFKVQCTSGDSYRAAPVRGRYHFKRWSGR